LVQLVIFATNRDVYLDRVKTASFSKRLLLMSCTYLFNGLHMQPVTRHVYITYTTDREHSKKCTQYQKRWWNL